ncbi:LuxR family transcriptional regulator [Rhizobium sp. SAFR-030]|uniref:LuxR family transcriptional regulator n=1 Tax=Rhizobium sp. SAFR-030 TaxID=3387277 RepID=UPI003F7E175A
MNVHSILQLLVLINETKTQADLTAELETLMSGYGFDYHGVWIHDRSDKRLTNMMMVGRWPEGWRKHYKTKNYASIDPLRRMLARAQRPYRWRDAIQTFRDDPYRKRMMRLLQDASKVGLIDGYVFPIYGKTGLIGQFNIGGRPIDLSPVEMSLLDAAGRKMFWRLLEMQGIAADLETSVVIDPELTRRQMEVLKLLAEGMTSNEIARELQISSHTVDWYINVIQEKFHARNRQHVIATAFRLGLMT